MSGLILAHDGLLMMTGDVMPLDTVSVEVIEDGHAGLLLPALPHLLPVVWLRLAGTASVGPVSELERMT